VRTRWKSAWNKACAHAAFGFQNSVENVSTMFLSKIQELAFSLLSKEDVAGACRNT